MGDLDQYVTMLTAAGIEYTKEESARCITISVERGYAGFVVEAEFSVRTGTLLDIGAEATWE